MTATIERDETRTAQTTQTTQTTPTTGVHHGEPAGLLTMLYAAIDAVCHADPGELGSSRPAGRDLLGLAAAARAAVAALGREPGQVVTEGPGVVVVRELVAATRALAAATAGPAQA